MVLSDTLLCLDPGFSLDEARNSSLIFAEYWKKLRSSIATSALLAPLFSGKRIKEVPTKVSDEVRGNVEKLIKASKSRDRTMLKVAHNSKSRRLVTHDGEDFPHSKRPKIKSKVKVAVFDAAEVDF